MPLTSRRLPISLLVATVVACSGDSTGPSSGSLSLTVLGLPGGSTAAVLVTGPGGYSQAIPASQTLTPLTAGTYTVTASDVTVGPTTYSGNPATQTVTVAGLASASVAYTATAGTRLLVNVNGLESGTPASITVTGPGGYSQTISSTQTLGGLTPGTYTVAAQSVISGGTTYAASPASQNATITDGQTGTATVTYAPPTGGSLNLRIDGMYLTQSTQTYTGTVPLVQNRNGYLRVFVTADGANLASPNVRIRLYHSLVLVSEQIITRATLGVPTTVDEGSLSNSWNLPIAGSLIRPGLSILAEVDLGNNVMETNESDNVFPAAAPQALSVRSVPTLNMTLVPVRQRGNGLIGNASNTSGFLDAAQRMHPLGSYSAQVHAAYTTTTMDTLEDVNGNGAWGTILGEIDLLRTAEGSSRYYYGVARVSYSSGVAGVAYVSTQFNSERAALGWDYLPSGSVVAAHELAHNWGRNHAPCGNPGGVDIQYPHPDGSTGVYGLDVAAATLKPPTSIDIMGYCDPKWIGDYTYQAILNYLSPVAPTVTSASASEVVQPSLLIWGRVRDGQVVLEPAFQVTTRPKLPQRSGTYSVEAKSAEGTTLFNLSFEPDEVADAPGNQRNFVFAVPLPPATMARIATLRLSGPGRRALIASALAGAGPDPQPSSGSRPDSVEVRRVSGDRLGLRWNARAHPMIMVRDAATGEVLSLARGGDVQFSTPKSEVDLVLSDGVRSRVKRVSAK